MNQGNKNTIPIKRTLSSAMILVIGLVLFSQNALAATGINKQINFQGKVVNTDGTNVANASYNFLFCIYTTASPATPCTAGADNDAVWRESKSLTVTDGVFQSNLGDTTAFASLIDFNTDNIYLGINFNSNGQMTPLVRFTAAPYALNAAKVGGLTVTDTTGTLTIPNAKTISFADAFTTSGAFATTLTSTGITNATLPAGTVTLVDLATTQTLTNKIVGSTGLTFTGATTDITTGTDEDLTVTANGAGIISLNDSVTVANALAANGGITFDASSDTVGSFTSAGTILMNTNILQDIGNTGTDFIASTGALTLAGVLTANGGVSIAGGQSLTAGALSYVDLGSIVHNTTAVQGLRLPQATSATPSDPTSGEGYLAWDAAGNQLITYNGSAWATVGGGSGYNLIKDETTGLTARTTLAFLGAGVSCADSGSQTECTISGGAGSDLQGTYGTDADGLNATISLTAADDGLIFTNPSSGGNDLSNFLLQLDQANTTANVLALDIVQRSNAANGANLTANAIDTETGLSVTTNGITSGSAVSVASSSAAMTGNLLQVTMSGSNAANTGDLLELSNTGTNNANTTLHIDHRATGTGNLAMRVDDVASDTTPFIIDGDGNVGIQTSTATEALQVGSGTSRANISAYGDITSEGYDIQRSLSGIIDIFVYDTTRDSDAGEWRNSLIAQQMSWATETKDNTGPSCVIGTDDRCGKSVFPRKAIIATTTTGLYIFDGADNTLWMSFTQAGTYALGADTNNNPSGVGAQNGVIVVGTNGTSATGMYTFDFKQDQMYRYNATNRVQGDKNIGNRNSAVTYATDANTSFALIDTIVNDVSLAMITSSTEGMVNTLTLPTDSATSPMRGMTLIAAATDSGISVVNMASRKTLNYSDVTGNDYNQVVITSRARLYATNEALAQMEEWRNVDRDVVSEVNGTPDRFYDETVGRSPITTGTVPTMTTSPGSLAVIERSSSARESSATTLLESGDIVFVGTNQGLAEIHTSGGNLVAASWSKLTTTTVATPYMNGTVRSVYLFDEAAGATTAASAIGAAGTTNNPMDSAVTGTAPTFGGGGVRGTSVNFNNNSYLCSDANGDGTCDADADFNAVATSFTVSLWFKHSTTAAADTLFERCYTPATPSAAVCIYAGMHTTGQIRFAVDDDATWTYNSSYDDTILSTASYNDDQWHHAVFTNTDTDICMYIDGKQAVACDSTLAAAATLDGSQVLTIGGTCAGAACVTGANFWNGSIDDFTWDSNGGTTASGLSAQSANKMYLDGRAHLIRPTATVSNATAFSSTTIGHSGEAFIPGSFVGLIVELNGGTGSGQTRTIIANDATTFTVYPAFAVTPDATTDFRVSSTKIYGSSNNVVAIAPDLPTNLNKIRKVYVGTNDGSDGGGVSVFTNAGAGSIKTEVIHSDAGYAADDFGSTWSGTDADDISAIASYSDTVAIGSGAFMRAQRKEISLKQLQLDTIGGFEDIRQELVAKQLFGSTQDVLGLGQGADLAEQYYSNEALVPGDVVTIDPTLEAGVKRSTEAYQRTLIGIVATKPGIILGEKRENSYPIALVGRVPVNATTVNGLIHAGDRLVSSSKSGFAMRAVEAGRAIGAVLEDPDYTQWSACSTENPAVLCGQVDVFVNLSDYLGASVDVAMQERSLSDGIIPIIDTDSIDPMVSVTSSTEMGWYEQRVGAGAKILAYLDQARMESEGSGGFSEVYATRIIAKKEIIAPKVITDLLIAKKIQAESIEGLEIFTDRIAALEEADSEKSVPIDESTLTDATKAAVTETLKSMKAVSFDRLIVKMEFVVNGKFKALSGMFVDGDAEFAGKGTFEGDVALNGETSFAEAPMYMTSVAGYAVIEKGSDEVKVRFDKKWEVVPIIQITMVYTGKDGKVADFFDAKYRSVIKDADEDGFAILLNQEATDDVKFAWTALQVKDAKTWKSGEKEVKKAEVVAPVISETAPVLVVPDPIVPQTPETEIIQEEVVPVEVTSGGDNTPAGAPVADTAS
ncbi:MAG: hypothetical protein KA034_00725 [Candidatus Moranbacteria bacterium]|nr:hypothetical protein [Candidatus Moranbacteria bacterium]